MVLFFGFPALENLSEMTTFGWNTFGIQARFNSISRGVIDTTDLIYFTSITIAFLGFTKLKLDND